MTAVMPKSVPGQAKGTAPVDQKQPRRQLRRQDAVRGNQTFAPGGQRAPKPPDDKADQRGVGLATLANGPAPVPGGGPAPAPAKPQVGSLEYLESDEFGQLDDDDKKDAKRAAYPAAVAKWAVPGLDAAGTVQYLVVEKKVTPDRYDHYVGQAQAKLDELRGKPIYQAYANADMTDDEMKAVILYTTDLSYALNAMLRGDLKSDPWVKPLRTLSSFITAALKKVPRGMSNKQFDDKKLDPKKADDDFIKYDKVYRSDFWSPPFLTRFAQSYETGNTLVEDQFLSTTIDKGSYGGAGIAVAREIEGAKVSKSVKDLSMSPQEKEALFAPGQAFKITGIEKKQGAKSESVKKPTQQLPDQDGGAKAFNKPGITWVVKMKHVSAPKVDKKKADPKKAKAQSVA